jgi:outer membrane biosynthesis protein TonB
MYPDDWFMEKDRWKGTYTGEQLNKSEQSLVKALIHNGINRAVIRREPDGKVESNLIIEPEEVPVRIKMFLDYATQHAVEDHKFCGSTRYYGKDKLKNAIAMNLYAHAQYLGGIVTDPKIWLRYNLFVKDPNKLSVKSVEVQRTREDVEHFFTNRVLPLCEDMFALFERQVDENDWHKVAQPENLETCNNYGGCPYQSICTGRQSVAQYRECGSASAEDREKREDKALQALTSGSAGIAGNEGVGKMASFKEMLAMKRAADQAAAKEGTAAPATAPTQAPEAQAPEAQAPAAPVEKEPEAPVAPAAPEEGQLSAPWYVEGCKSCSDAPVRGLNTKNRACAMCGLKCVKAGLPTPELYKIRVQDDGSIIILDKEENIVLNSGAPEVGTGRDVVEPAAEKVEEPVSEPEPVEAPVEEATASEQAPVEEPTPEPTPEEKPAPKKRRTAAQKATDEAKAVLEEVKVLAAETQATVTALRSGQAASAPSQATGESDGVPFGSRSFTLSYAPVRQKGDNTRQMGSADCVVHISDLLTMVHDKLKELKGLDKDSSAYEMDTFKRRDLIRENIGTIADALGASIVDASATGRGGDEEVLASSLEHLACLVFGSLR